MNFSAAIIALKDGKKITRKGWNGKGMYLYLCEGQKVPIDKWQTRAPSQEPTEHEIAQGYVEILPHIDMYTVNSVGRRARLCGWLASQTDMLSDDWEIVN